MTDEEIKSIAREYALKKCSAIVPAGRIDFIINDFIEQLSNDYCIVPKEQVKEKYALCKMGYTECEGLELGFVMDALEDIFGKDMFEEEKI